MFGKIFLWLSI